MMDNYKPIDCGLHSEYELLAMRQTRIRLVYHTGSGDRLQEVGQVIDVLTRSRAEYLVLSRESQPPLQVRLDRIHSLIRQDGLS